MTKSNKLSLPVLLTDLKNELPVDIISIRSSTGNIEAITRLITSLQTDLGFAYIIIIQLNSPPHKGILPELIQKETNMQVYQATEGMLLQRNSIYFIPPNALMAIDNGHFKLSPYERVDGNSLATDFLMNEFPAVCPAKATEQKNSKDLLLVNEEKLNLLIQNTFDILTILSATGNILYESESIEEVLGYKPSERVNTNIFINTIVHPDDKAIKEDMFNTALRKPNENIKAEFRLRHKDGSYRYMEAVCKNLLDDFRIEGIIAHYRDITERHLLEKQKDQFIGIASHELKTPVTSIKGYAQVLEQLFTESEDKKALELIKKMDGQINRLTTLIKDLLDVTQITEGQLKLKKESFDMNELITEVTDEIQQVTLKHKLVKELQPLDKIVADKEKTRQVLVNFISNAIKYSPNADTVIISSSGDGEAISVSVQDFGIGIAEATQPKIFDRFFRDADPSINTYPGLGLGLYIAAEIVKKQGGKITLKSTKNVGSAFTFSLPVKGVS